MFIFSACGCSRLGTIGVCNPQDGICTCKRFVMGARCDRCQVSCVYMVVYHLPKNFGNPGWNVNGKVILVFPTGKFPKFSELLER